jgi:S-adenosylmethionine-diacylgycerolhomoserine-N-methlytransferase
MSFVAELKILYRLAFAPIRGATHQERLESFYAGQANDYDAFRKKLLHGREELYQALETPADGVWVEMGAGTGSNLEFLGDRIRILRQVHLVDLSSSLLQVAGERIQQNHWTHAATHVEDVTTFSLAESADVVTFSYSLTMIPDWFAAIENALRLLKPGGTIGVVDFYVSRKHPAPGFVRHPWWTRSFWPVWFGNDNVHPCADHVPYLQRHFEPVHFAERRGRVPWLPFVAAPYYVFIGRKPLGI